MVRFRPQLWPTLISVPALLLTLSLGYWQLERREWKHGIIDMMETRLAAEPVGLPAQSEWPSIDPAAWDFRPIHAKGAFHHDKEMHRFTHVPGAGAGYSIITPLALEDGGFVLVDRGFVPEHSKERSSRPQSLTPGQTRIEGVARAANPRDAFVPDDAVTENIWYHRDLEAMGAHTGLKPIAPFFLVATGPQLPAGHQPQPQPARLDLPDNHLSYAITWFGLAGAITVIYVIYHRRREDAGR